MRYFVLHPAASIDPRYASDARLKNRSKAYTLHPPAPHGHLYRADTSTGTLRRHVGDHEVWEMLTAEHVRSGHKGRDRMLGIIKERFVGYTLEELMFVLSTCRVCQGARGGGGASTGTGTPRAGMTVELAQKVRQSLGEFAALAEQRSPSPPLMRIDVAAAGAGRDGLGDTVLASTMERMGNMGAAVRVRAAQSSPVAVMAEASRAFQAPPPALQWQRSASGVQAQTMGSAVTVGGWPRPAIPRTSLYATDEQGMVVYDVPDWYN